jgi:cell wall-associated NlpC family hydrolase
MPIDAVLHLGGKSESARKLQAATNRRLRARDLGALAVPENGLVDHDTLVAVRKAAWALGAMLATCERILQDRAIAVGVQQMIRNPGTRNAQQMDRGRRRMAAMRAARKKRAEEAKAAGAQRRAVVAAAKKAAANYRANPGAYHYLMDPRVANTIIMRPTPPNYRSDCSQFVVNVYREAGIERCPGVGSYLYSGTATIADPKGGGQIVRNPRPGDLAMYATSMANPRGTTHHVEMYIGEPGCMFIGHGSAPIDSMTPGQPDYYLSFLP